MHTRGLPPAIGSRPARTCDLSEKRMAVDSCTSSWSAFIDRRIARNAQSVPAWCWLSRAIGSRLALIRVTNLCGKWFGEMAVRIETQVAEARSTRCQL